MVCIREPPLALVRMYQRGQLAFGNALRTMRQVTRLVMTPERALIQARDPLAQALPIDRARHVRPVLPRGVRPMPGQGVPQDPDIPALGIATGLGQRTGTRTCLG